MQGNIIRSNNVSLNKLYQEGKKISRKHEIKKGNSKIINQVQDDDDNIYNTKHEILNIIQQFYQSLYTSQNIDDNDINDYLLDFQPTQITDEEKKLGRFISEKEIIHSVDQQKDNKFPGEDGITAELYKKFKKQLVPILCEV